MTYILSNNTNNSSLQLYVLTKYLDTYLSVTSNGDSDAFKRNRIYLFKNIYVE